MARPHKPRIREEELQGFSHFRLLSPVLQRLHDDACRRDRAGNRILHFDQYVALILLYFFNPIVTSLRGIQQTSELAKVQEKLGCSRASLGSLSEAARVFDPDLLRGILGELLEKLPPIQRNTAFDEIRGVLTLVDGTLLPALPKLVEAMWRDDEHRAFKLHTHFELLKTVPVRMDLTDANTSEREVLESALERDRVYVMDRGYAKFGLFRKILDVGSSFVCRIRDNSVFDVQQERRLSAEVVALIYKHRWAIETFFRFFKSVLGCRHLLSHSTNGIEIQTYVAMIACLLIALWTGRKPTRRTYEMLCFYFIGLATEEELLAHIAKLAPQS